MKHLAVVLSSTLLAAGASLAEDGVRLRYAGSLGSVLLSATEEIELRLEHPIEARRSVEVELSDAGGAASTIEAVAATSVAHGMEQRLPTRHLARRTLAWELADGGRRVEPAPSEKPAAIPLGQMVPEGLPVADLIASVLPVLPEESVAVGSAWTSERPVRSLEGWGWGAGALSSRHRVTAIDRREGHAIVRVESEERATLEPQPAASGFRGTIERKLTWTFDATDGRLVSATLDQESDGAFGDKAMPLHQRTTLEWKPADR